MMPRVTRSDGEAVKHVYGYYAYVLSGIHLLVSRLPLLTLISGITCFAFLPF